MSWWKKRREPTPPPENFTAPDGLGVTRSGHLFEIRYGAPRPAEDQYAVAGCHVMVGRNKEGQVGVLFQFRDVTNLSNGNSWATSPLYALDLVDALGLVGLVTEAVEEYRDSRGDL